jgi:hypothetical protein
VKEAQLFAALSESMPVHDAARVVSFQVPGSFEQRVGVFVAKERPEVSIVTTLGSLSEKVFVMVTDDAPDLLAEVVARAEYHDAMGGTLEVGHTLRLNMPSLAESGWAAVLFGVPAMLELLAAMPAQLSVSGASYGLVLCILLSPEEYDYKISEGVDALLDRFEATCRSLVSFRAP